MVATSNAGFDCPKTETAVNANPIVSLLKVVCIFSPSISLSILVRSVNRGCSVIVDTHCHTRQVVSQTDSFLQACGSIIPARRKGWAKAEKPPAKGRRQVGSV